MTINPYEPPRAPQPADDEHLTIRDHSPASDWQWFSRFTVLTIGLLAAPVLSLGGAIGVFALLVLVESWVGLPQGAISILAHVGTFVFAFLVARAILKRVATCLYAPENWEVAAVVLTVSAALVLLIVRYG